MSQPPIKKAKMVTGRPEAKGQVEVKADDKPEGNSKTVVEPKPEKGKTWAPKAALLPSTPGSLDGDFIASGLGSLVDIEVRLVAATTFGQEGLGFSLSFPRCSIETSEEDGFGVCHRFGHDNNRPVLSESLVLRVKFQDPKLSVCGLKDNIPGRNVPLPVELSSLKALTLVEIDHSGVSVYNFGMPFYNPGHATEDWLFHNKPIVGNTTLMHILKQQSFRFIVPAAADTVRERLNPARLPSLTVFPYGQEHKFDMDRYAEDAPKWAGSHYPACLTFRNDNDHIAVVSQSVVQDFWWLHLAQEAIAQSPVPVYFVPRDQDAHQAYYVVVTVPKSIKLAHDNAWRRFVKQDSFKVRLFEYCGQTWDEFDSAGKRLPVPDWRAKIVESPENIKVLEANGHLGYDPEGLVLCVFRPPADDEKAMPDFVLTEFNTLKEAEQSNFEH
ncbi:hypothetical protein N0V93_010164 [Gnomoniopsis smithogilvyi]|uniref:Uncharacterized protein n=1 Tax=Gnomoniopsis smithogilvyi TaxID=1191159 RepID=A0A9W9CS62_9PEZI|nr:hypothetical protein N0V93_010164 [Gnomoniopsis smithogilvyi]